MRHIPLHTTHEILFPTKSSHSAHEYGNIGVYVIATVSLIAFVEQTCGQILHPFLEPDEISVGTIVSIKHKAPAPIGAQIRSHAKLIKQNKNKFLFMVTVYHKDRLLLEGTHGRVVCSNTILSL
ncbi:MAG: thioesterase [Deltaproteobacteria bacterium]|nr:thioesterase [Deltaproteobacteria bacterium]